MVHHFPCAYVGPMEDFSNGVDDNLICPKCDKLLQHIGVDYDKPSVLYTCQKCHHKYQDYHTKGKCMTCGEENEVESLTSLEIKKYFITKKGEHAAITGYINLEDLNKSISGVLSQDIFNTLLNYEIKRLTDVNYNSNLAFLNIKKIAELKSKLGEKNFEALVKEIVGILKSNLHPSDFISFYNPSTLIFSMINRTKQDAKKELEETMNLINRLVKKSFESIHVKFEANITQLEKDLTPPLATQKLIAKLNAI